MIRPALRPLMSSVPSSLFPFPSSLFPLPSSLFLLASNPDQILTLNDPCADAKIQKLKEEEELGKEAKREYKRQKKEEALAKDKEGLADGFEDMMGFGGFGKKK